MSRKFERNLIYIVSIWQVVTGSITAGIYLFNIDQTLGATPQESTMGMFVFTYGMFYVVIGIINIILTRKFVEDQTIQKNMPVFWMVLIVVFIFLKDYVSLALLIIATILTLSKNKALEIEN